MKKTTLALNVLIGLSLLASANACKKSNTTNQSATLGKATVSGAVTALLVDTVGASTGQGAPAGTVVNAWIDTKDFVVNPSTSVTYAQRYYTTTVDANGKYNLNVDVSQYQPATVHVLPQTFIYNQVKNMHGITHPDSIYTVSHTYTSPAATITVFPNLSAILGISYN